MADVEQILWRVEEHEPVTEREWDPAVAREAIRAIVADAEAAERDGAWPSHPLDDIREEERLSSLYFGSAGMIWALSRLGQRSTGRLRSRARSTGTGSRRISPTRDTHTRRVS